MKEAFWIIDQLIQQGVTRFCIAPGSRNTPLVMAAVEHPQAETIVHYDERGLGFYALGYAKGADIPAAVITTSGTAVGNLLPSIMEAHHSCTPMILMTTDRPPELRDCGANQTCNQVNIFTHFTRWQADVPPQLTESYFRSITAQGVFHATQNPPGPIQLNCQFRDPLYHPVRPILRSGSQVQFPSTKIIAEPIQTDASKGLILIGKLSSDPMPILQLAKRLRWPVCADILSNARLYPTDEQISHFDWILKTTPQLQPDFVLHFGDRLTSKIALDLNVSLHVSTSPFLQDPARTLSSRICCDIASFCDQFTAKTDPSWLSLWTKRNREISDKSNLCFAIESSFTEAHAMQKLSEIMPKESALFLGNGMPIRDADRFCFPKQCKGFFSNRGLSGIDGNIATAAGLSDGLNAPVVAFLGDQTCLHDLNSLPFLKKTKNPLTIIASNNFGSGIFSHLPIADWPQFETYMAASHSWNFKDAANMFGIPYSSFENISFSESTIAELFTSREKNHHFQQTLLESCRQEI